MMNLLNEKTDNGAFIRGLLIVAFILAVLSLFGVWFSSAFFNVKVQQNSMRPTILDGDVVYARYSGGDEVERGDVIVFLLSDNLQTHYIKRVIAVGGDSLYADGGALYLKRAGESYFSLINESYLTYAWTVNNDIASMQEPVTVPVGQFYYMGDNRNVSIDSRANGCRELDAIRGIVPEWSISIKGFVKFIYNLKLELGMS